MTDFSKAAAAQTFCTIRVLEFYSRAAQMYSMKWAFYLFPPQLLFQTQHSKMFYKMCSLDHHA